MPRLIRIVIPVSDIEQAASFYFKVLGLPGKRVSPGRHFFELEGCILTCYDPLSNGDRLGKGWMHHEKQYVYISVKNLETQFIRFRNTTEAELDSDIHINKWGERLFHGRDPFGNPLCFVDEKTVFTG